jgi:hypothetical protein
MRGSVPLLSQYVFMAWCLVKHEDDFTFLNTIQPVVIETSVYKFEYI